MYNQGVTEANIPFLFNKNAWRESICHPDAKQLWVMACNFFDTEKNPNCLRSKTLEMSEIFNLPEPLDKACGAGHYIGYVTDINYDTL